MLDAILFLVTLSQIAAPVQTLPEAPPLTDSSSSEAGDALVAKYKDSAIKRWEADIKQLEKRDASEKDPDHAVLFIGSSSIRRWDTIDQDMAPWRTIQRGYGGARFSDLVVFTERIVHPHEFDALVIFVGNDIAGSDQDKSPEEALALYKVIVERVRKKHRDEPIFCIAVTPTSSRFDVWPQIQKMNGLLKTFAESNPSLHFIDTADAFLTEEGIPNDDLFVDDQLHLNAQGYRIWSDIIKQSLRRTLGEPVSN